MTYTVIISQDPEEDREVYNARVPALPGCVSWGRTVEEAYQAIHEAIALYLDEFEKAPPDVYCESGEVTV